MLLPLWARRIAVAPAVVLAMSASVNAQQAAPSPMGPIFRLQLNLQPNL